MLVGGRLGHVLAPPEDPGRFYGRAKTGPNTDSSRKKIEKSGREGDWDGGVKWMGTCPGVP